MLIVALVLAVIGLVSLVTAVVTGNEVIAWVCIGAAVIGVVLLILDALRERQSRDAGDDVSDETVDESEDEPGDESEGESGDYTEDEPDGPSQHQVEPELAEHAGVASAEDLPADER